MQEINDELMIPCAQCARKHLSAAIGYYADAVPNEAEAYELKEWKVLFARGLVNLCEATEGYASHLPFAVGLFVKAEEAARNAETRKAIREFRTAVVAGKWPQVPAGFDIYPSSLDWYHAHLQEAEREFPELSAGGWECVEARANASLEERKQAEIETRLNELKWLDENVFGVKPVEKGDKEMATKKANPFAKKGVKADPKAAKKAACKGGKCKSGCKK